MTAEVESFDFGHNWLQFVERNFSEEREVVSRKHLLSFLQLENLNGRSFVDVGCGSGLHSLSALRAGARRIVSLDVNPKSLAATQKLRELAGSPDHWEVHLGSALDKRFLETVSPGDIVYSWGVLHHTGDMWQAVANVAGLVNPGGLLYVALYQPPALGNFWPVFKRHYNRCPAMLKRFYDYTYAAHFLLRQSISEWRNPIGLVREHRKSRGMEFMTDIRDWLGGWPYEFATVEQVTEFMIANGHFTRINLAMGEANIEYLFRRPV